MRWLPLVLQGALLAAADPAPLDLGQALRLALAQNPAIQRARLEEARLTAQAQAARGGLLPSLSAQAGQVRQKINFEALAGMPVPGFPRVIGPFSVRSFAAEAQVPLLDLSLWQRWRGAQWLEQGARAESGQMREEVSALVVGQFLLGLRSEAWVRAVQARIELARALEQLAVHQEQSGVGTGLDTLRARVRTRTEEQGLLRAQTAREEAMAGLVRLLDLPPERTLALRPLADPPPGGEGSFAQDLAMARDRRPEFKVLEALGQAADARTRAQDDQRLPTVQAFASYESMGLVTTNLLPIYAVGVQVRIPLFEGGRLQAQASQARAERAQVASRNRDLEARVAYEVRTARQRLDAARHELAVAQDTVRLSREELAQARHRFEAGVANNIELITAQEELARAEEGQLDARYRLDQAAADLAHAKGALEADYGL